MAAFQTVLSLADERLGPTYAGLYGIAKDKEDSRKKPMPGWPIAVAPPNSGAWESTR